MTPFIIQLAMLEIVSIKGFVVSTMKEQNLILPFLILSGVGFMTCFPDEDKIRQRLGIPKKA